MIDDPCDFVGVNACFVFAGTDAIYASKPIAQGRYLAFWGSDGLPPETLYPDDPPPEQPFGLDGVPDA